ncbi:MAG TPA: DUF4350 domain-containing protein [Verrucomicrobiae bacterium]|jgi:hypothetical protein|nr:DUF4350 domain-containing protein [Verrucomicrobiae bacterium]
MNRKLPLILLFVCASVFVFGIVRLFELRFESGDVYPPYSTLRADPLGTSALYESLGRVPGISPSRDFSANNELPEGRDTTYMHLAGDRDEWRYMPEDTFREVETFVRGGGRLVVAFFPETRESFYARAREKNLKEETDKPGNDGKTNSVPIKPGRVKKTMKNGHEELFATISLKDRWGLDFGFKRLPQGEGDAYDPVNVTSQDEPELPLSLSWHSGSYFTNLDPAWKVVYARQAAPVMVERKFGGGTVVFCTDTYFLSNEAMLKERHADLLAWVIGPSSRVMFDEAHLGIVEEPGVAMLVRKYRLHGLVAGLLLLAGLFIWKNSSRFAPGPAEEKPEDFVSGKDSATGFVNLLRRHIAAGDVLNVCVAEWRRSIVRGTYPAARLARAQEAMAAGNALPPAQRHPVETYQAICRALKDGSSTRMPIAGPNTLENPATKPSE